MIWFQYIMINITLPALFVLHACMIAYNMGVCIYAPIISCGRVVDVIDSHTTGSIISCGRVVNLIDLHTTGPGSRLVG